MAFLQIVKGSRPGQILELRGERMVLGRHPTCEIVLDNAAVSRQHAQITNRHGHYFLEDLRSRNRTYLNGAAIDERTPLSDADEVKICDIVLQFFSAAQPPVVDRDSDDGSAPGGAGTSDERNPAKTILSGLPGDDADDVLLQSSIITTLNAKTAATQRLGVKPEVKLRAILEISNSLARTLKLDDVLQGLLDGLFKVFPQADTGFVVLADREEGKSLVRASQARGADATGSVRISNTIVKNVMESGEAILSADALEDSRFKASDSLDGLAIRSMLCVPLLSQEGRALGVIQLDTKSLRHQFTQTDLDVLVSVGRKPAWRSRTPGSTRTCCSAPTSSGSFVSPRRSSSAFCPNSVPIRPATNSSITMSRPTAWGAITSIMSSCRTGGLRSVWPTSPEKGFPPHCSWPGSIRPCGCISLRSRRREKSSPPSMKKFIHRAWDTASSRSSC